MKSLRIYFIIVLVAMLAATGWASSHVALWKMPREVATHPWFIATLFDTYFAFIVFWLWLAWRERTWPARIGWLVGILLLGANALLFIAERTVPIGLASLLIASVPLWIVLMRTVTGGGT